MKQNNSSLGEDSLTWLVAGREGYTTQGGGFAGSVPSERSGASVTLIHATYDTG